MADTVIRPQSLIFTLFGDYVHHRGDRIWVGSLIRLLALFGVSDQAVRSTLSRMVRRGWLRAERAGKTSYYALTLPAQRMIVEGAERIFHVPSTDRPWTGCWQLVTYSIPEEQREARDAFRGELISLGYGMLTNAVWLSPYDRSQRLESLAGSLGIRCYVQLFNGRFEGFSPCRELAARCWELETINARYAAFIAKYAPLMHECEQRGMPGDDQCFLRRFMLIHEYRRFPFRDPHLPEDLLPAGWRGAEAAALFQKYHALLAAGANRYFESVFR
jgi:phenylacetic acid degradation operon negative regulatory protein